MKNAVARKMKQQVCTRNDGRYSVDDHAHTIALILVC